MLPIPKPATRRDTLRILSFLLGFTGIDPTPDFTFLQMAQRA
jgi:hypothetical protein